MFCRKIEAQWELTGVTDVLGKVHAMHRKIECVPILLVCFLTISCGSEPPYVYVPAEGFKQSLTVSALTPQDRAVRVGEWVALKATRMTGPWKRIKRSLKEPGDCWWVRPPKAIEEEVQGNVTWHVEPSGNAVFNLPGKGWKLWERSVRFTKPGLYRLSATSAGCGSRFRSNVIEITVGQVHGHQDFKPNQ